MAPLHNMRTVNVIAQETNWNIGHYKSLTNIFVHWPDFGRDTRLFCLQASTSLKRQWRHQLFTVAPQCFGDGLVRILDHRFLKPYFNTFFRYVTLRSVRSGDVVIVWPSNTETLLDELKARGCIIIVEFINTHCGFARNILMSEYESLGIKPRLKITDNMVAADTKRIDVADLIFCNSRFTEQSILAYRDARSKILSTSRGADPQPGRAPRRRRNDVFRFVFVGYFGVRKGGPRLVEACRQLGSGIEVMVAGRVEKDMTEYLTRVGIPENLRLLGFVRDVDRVYEQADAFVLPSLEEGDPKAAYEAAAFGLPIVATAIGGGRVAQDGQTAFIVPPGDSSALADAMARMSEDAELYEAFSGAVLERAARYSWRAVAEERHRQLLERGL